MEEKMKIAWESDLDRALERAREEGKAVFVDFFAPQ